MNAQDTQADVLAAERRMGHTLDLDTDRCICGGEVVTFEDGDDGGQRGEGCDVAGRVWWHLRRIEIDTMYVSVFSRPRDDATAEQIQTAVLEATTAFARELREGLREEFGPDLDTEVERG